MIGVPQYLLIFSLAFSALVASCVLSEEINADTLQGLTKEAFFIRYVTNPLIFLVLGQNYII